MIDIILSLKMIMSGFQSMFLRKKAHLVEIMVSVRVDMEKNRMWALVWNRWNTMNIPTRNTRGLENDDHVFKWVDEAFTDEIQQLDNQV
ncbi:unnamed protein product, partial [Brassica rapa subsp. trilocularis]